MATGLQRHIQPHPKEIRSTLMTDRILSVALLAALVFVLVLPGYTQSDPPQGGYDHSSHKTNAKSTNVSPVAKAIEINEAEVELGKIALGKAENARVKDFASMMVKEHSDALNKLRAVQGAPSDVKLNAKDQQAADRLSKLSGAEFDREYMRVMVTDHQEAVKFFHQLSSHGRTTSTYPSGRSKADQNKGAVGDRAELATVAQEIVPTLQLHLQQAQEIQKELQTGSKSNKQTSSPKSTPATPGRSKPY